MAPADLDRVTVQEVIPPAASLMVEQVTEDSVGVDQSVMLLDLDPAPSVAVIATVVSAETLPMLALNVLVALPAGTTMLPGTVTRAEFELIARLVSNAAVDDRVAVHEVVPPDMTPDGEHATELI